MIKSSGFKMDHSAPSVSGGWGGGRQTQNALSHSPGHVDLVYQPCLSTLFTRDLMHTLLSRRHIPFFILYPVDQFSTPIQLFVTSNPLLLLFFVSKTDRRWWSSTWCSAASPQSATTKWYVSIDFFISFHFSPRRSSFGESSHNLRVQNVKIIVLGYAIASAHCRGKRT